MEREDLKLNLDRHDMLFSLKNSYLYVQNVKNYHWMVFQTPKVSFSRTQCSVLADEECFRWYTGGSPLRVDINYDIWCRESGRECWLEHRLWILQFPHQLAPAPDRNHWHPDVNVQCHTNKEYFSQTIRISSGKSVESGLQYYYTDTHFTHRIYFAVIFW